MELDNFRRQWQAQPIGLAADTAASEQALRAMLTSHTSSNPLIRLKKNASRELKFVLAALALIIFDAAVFFRHVVRMQLFAALLFCILCLILLIVYQRVKLIRQMEQQQDDLYQFLNIRITRFRHLMRLHDYVGAGTLALLAVFVGVVRRSDLAAYLRPAESDWGWHLAAVGGGLLIILALIYAAYFEGRKEHQRRYGRYLDQLEAALSELRE